MTDEKRAREQGQNPNPQNLSEAEPEATFDPLTDTRSVAQTPTDDADIVPLPEDADGNRAGDRDLTTGATHPAADSGGDDGVERRSKS